MYGKQSELTLFCNILDGSTFEFADYDVDISQLAIQKWYKRRKTDKTLVVTDWCSVWEIYAGPSVQDKEPLGFSNRMEFLE
jgi:hypothetical protein